MGRTRQRLTTIVSADARRSLFNGAPSAGNAHAAPDRSFERQCLRLLLEILADSGLPIARLRSVANRVIDELPSSQQSWNAADLYYLDRLPHVLSLWHLDEDYVDPQGRPRSLPFGSRTEPSLAKLIQRVFPHEKADEVRATLHRVGAIYPTGRSAPRRWLPTGRTLVFESPRLARLRILSDVIHFLGTARHNLTHATGKRLQRSAFNAAVPVRALRGLHRRAVQAAEALLIEHDANLERQARSARPSEPTTGTGVGIYLYRSIHWTTEAPSSTSFGRSARKKAV